MNGKDILNLFTRIQDRESSVQIQKLAGTTRINDCTDDLWKMTGHTDRIQRCPIDAPYPLIKDLGYPVWRCRLGMKHYNHWHYGKSIIEAIKKALA